MCGIFGKLFFEKTKIDPKLYQENLDSLRHRGPDDEGFYWDDHIVLGNRRLSIIDRTSQGHMPMTNEDKSLWITFNGEIYNFRELRKKLEKRHNFRSKTDTEVILHLYEEKGKDCLKELRGMFAFAIWDRKNKELFIARDRLGKKPVKYYYNNKFFIFASELKAILKDKTVPKEIDHEAIDEYLTYQYIPSPKTGFKNINKLEPAHYLVIDLSGEIKKKRYWNLDFDDKLHLREEEWEERILAKLKESVKIRLMSDVPLGAYLSGGIDSSLITALMSEELNKPVETFSIGFEEADYNELPYARLVADRYKTNHHELIVKPDMINILLKLTYFYEEPYGDPSALPTWYLSKLTKKDVTVVLNGDGGDENFGGYIRYNLFKLYQFLRSLPFNNGLSDFNKKLYRLSGKKIFNRAAKFFQLCKYEDRFFYLNLINYFSQEDKKAIYTDNFKHKTAKSHWDKFLLSKFNQANNLDWLDKLLYVDIQSYLPDDLLTKVDIAGMAHSLETRSPFLDHEFVELAAKIPSNLKINGFNRKYLLKKIAKKYLPEKNIQRSKKGFVFPLDYWLQHQLKNHLKEKLLDKKFLSFGFFKGKEIENMTEKQNNKAIKNYSNQLWTLLMLEEWLEAWF